MKYIFLVQLLFLCRLVGFAQQVMLADSITKNSVGYATVYDSNGTVVGRSDIGGYINLQKGYEYHISHISYEPKGFVHNGDSIILLSPSSFNLSEVSVTAKRKRYYHCKVYFRSIEHVDSCLKYYMDGIREFFIDTKSKKVHLGNVVTNYFTSKCKDIAQKNRSMMIGDKYKTISTMKTYFNPATDLRAFRLNQSIFLRPFDETYLEQDLAALNMLSFDQEVKKYMSGFYCIGPEAVERRKEYLINTAMTTQMGIAFAYAIRLNAGLCSWIKVTSPSHNMITNNFPN